MDWRWRGLSARPSLQRTSKASTKGAVKEAAMVKLPLLCPELVLQAMKVIFSGRQGKSADGWTSSLAQKSVGTYNWLMRIPCLSQHSTCRKIPFLFKTHLTVYIRAALPLSLGAVVFTSCMQMLHPTGCWRLWSAVSCRCQHCWYHNYWLYSVGREKQITEPVCRVLRHKSFTLRKTRKTNFQISIFSYHLFQPKSVTQNS